MTPRDLLAQAPHRPWSVEERHSFPCWLDANGDDLIDRRGRRDARAIYGLAAAAVNEYEALLDIADAARSLAYSWHIEPGNCDDPLCTALARLDALRSAA